MTSPYSWGGDQPPESRPDDPGQQPYGTWPPPPPPPQRGGDNPTQQLYLPPGFDTGQQQQPPPGYGPPGYGPAGYGPSGYGPGGYGPPGGGAHTFRRVLISVVVVIVLLIVGAIVLIGRSLSSGGPSAASLTTPSAAASTSAVPSPPPSSPPPPPPVSGLIASFSGHGAQTTRQFTVPANWSLRWSYDCAAGGISFGRISFFSVAADNPGSNFPDVAVPPVFKDKKKGQGTIHVTSDAGVRTLRITTFCAWNVQVTG